jgi:hypothetical protein
MSTFEQDLKYAVRALARNPGLPLQHWFRWA